MVIITNLWLLVESSNIPTNNLLDPCERIFFQNCPEHSVRGTIFLYLTKMLNNTHTHTQPFNGPVKNRVVGCWHGYLSGARCRLANAPADATATHYLLLQ